MARACGGSFRNGTSEVVNYVQFVPQKNLVPLNVLLWFIPILQTHKESRLGP